MRMGVFGAGGVGGYFGGRLALAGQDVTFIARGEHLRAMKETGLQIDSLDGDFRIHPINATSDPAEAGPMDLIVVAVKAWQVTEAAKAMKPMVGPATTVMPFENGVDASAQLAAELGQESAIGGLCKIVSFVVEPGHIRHAGFAPSIMLGELDNRRSDRIEKILQAFTTAGLDATIPEDINVALWQKFLFIAAYSGVGALRRTPVGVLRRNSEDRALLLQAMEEINTLARARGINLPEDTIQKSMASIDGLPEDATSSMQRDIMDGKPSELEAQTGAIVRMALESGVDVPTNEFIYQALSEVVARVP
jgi:2-dehydropantoate 2-reductase